MKFLWSGLFLFVNSQIKRKQANAMKTIITTYALILIAYAYSLGQTHRPSTSAPIGPTHRPVTAGWLNERTSSGGGSMPYYDAEENERHMRAFLGEAEYKKWKEGLESTMSQLRNTANNTLNGGNPGLYSNVDRSPAFSKGKPQPEDRGNPYYWAGQGINNFPRAVKEREDEYNKLFPPATPTPSPSIAPYGSYGEPIRIK